MGTFLVLGLVAASLDTPCSARLVAVGVVGALGIFSYRSRGSRMAGLTIGTFAVREAALGRASVPRTLLLGRRGAEAAPDSASGLTMTVCGCWRSLVGRGHGWGWRRLGPALRSLGHGAAVLSLRAAGQLAPAAAHAGTRLPSAGRRAAVLGWWRDTGRGTRLGRGGGDECDIGE